ncbi:hsp70-binding protein 1 [Anopheles stephensi]|uniref:Fes1 domain-containing protein n=1 Tax=Anopheles stephensi TaxID=30069 RepID=A0A182YDT5_ANOST|nr:hsp70-binding protein 1 [Anopheles stephensi]
MASGEDPEQPRQPRNMQGLLKFAMEATKSEDAPNPAQLQPMDEERRRFLEEALKSLTVNVIEELEKAMNVLLDNESNEDAKTEAIETVIDYVQDMDTANDFLKVGGSAIIEPGLESPSSRVRSGTLRLIGELTQNSPFGQKHLLELNILEKLTQLLGCEPSVSQQAMHAISCMVRHYEPCLTAFIEIGGLECILACIQTDDEKLRIRASFLIANLCTEHEPLIEEFVKLNAVERVMAGLQPARSYDAKLETALSTLNLLTESKEGIRRCRASDTFKQKLETIVKLNEGKKECQEQLEYAQSLLKRCYSGEQEGADR